jgi:hypothetical protein
MYSSQSLERIGPSQITDLYLLGLAAKRGRRFSTFHTRVQPDAIQHGENYLEIIPALQRRF